MDSWFHSENLLLSALSDENIKIPRGPKNKAGHAVISRVWLGRGSNAQKLTKTLFLRKRDQRTNGRMDGQMDGRTHPLIEMRGASKNS